MTMIGSIKSGVLAAGLLAAAAGAAQADCTAINEAVRGALAQKNVGLYDDLYAAMVAEPTCDGAYRDRVGRTMARSALTTIAINAPASAIESTLRFGRPWQVLVALGDVYYEQQQWARVVGTYEEALDDMRNVTANPKPPPAEVERRVYKRAVEARALAPDFLPTRRFRGKIGGLASPDFRNFSTEAVPVPVRFDFDSDRLTADGLAAVRDIFDYLNATYPDYVAIIGHTDPKGTEAYNDGLSLRRAQSVASYLYDLGYAGTIETLGYGERQRFVPDDPSKYTTDQLHAFDRRVEYRLTR